MQPQDLRIGNLVYWIDRSHSIHMPGTIPYKIIGIELFTVKAVAYFVSFEKADKYFEFSIKDLSPITLLNEWLLCFGFILNKKNSYYHPSTMLFDIVNTTALDNGIRWRAIRNKYMLTEPIVSVHHLQNFFFCATNKELVCDFDAAKILNLLPKYI